jgi:hypothetical protein
MTQNNYSLDVISHHRDFSGKTLKKYNVEGIETVGAFGDEPFEIKFTNHTWQKVQVKVSLDGTDVLSGSPANTSVDNNMWVVNGYGTLNLKAWPETAQGGAAFVFTSANNSVAVHTHGNLSARGIIAVAVFVEGHVEPIRYDYPIVITQPVYPYGDWHYRYDHWYHPSDNYKITCGGVMTNQSFSSDMLRSNNVNTAGTTLCGSSQTLSFNSVGQNSNVVKPSNNLESLASVGAGQYTNQKISYVQGLIKPMLTETVRIRYMWYDDLVATLRQHNVPAPHASGFPGDKKQGINLGGTPRVGGYHQPAFPRSTAPLYARV